MNYSILLLGNYNVIPLTPLPCQYIRMLGPKVDPYFSKHFNLFLYRKELYSQQNQLYNMLSHQNKQLQDDLLERRKKNALPSSISNSPNGARGSLQGAEVENSNWALPFTGKYNHILEGAKMKTINKNTMSNPREDPQGQNKSKLEENPCKTEENSLLNIRSASSSTPSIRQEDAFGYYKDAIIHIMNHFLNHFGKITQDEIEKLKMRYAHDTILTELFDTLVSRYKAANKSREDMVRFVMRKSLTWLRDQTRSKSQMSAKAASVALCHRYFTKDATDFQKNKRMLDTSDDELLSLVLPYKKNSRHSVVNSQFMKEIFSSEEFSQDYLDYLQNYSEIMEQENQKKVRQFNDFLLSCVREKCLQKVANYKRIPWLDVWIESSQTIGHEIYELHACKGEEKSQISLKPEKRTKKEKIYQYS